MYHKVQFGLIRGDNMNEIIATGRHYRVMTDLVNKVWTRYSFWKLARDVFNNSNKNLEETCGNIYGITDEIDNPSSNLCASSYAVKQINDKLMAIDS